MDRALYFDLLTSPDMAWAHVEKLADELKRTNGEQERVRGWYLHALEVLDSIFSRQQAKGDFLGYSGFRYAIRTGVGRVLTGYNIERALACLRQLSEFLDNYENELRPAIAIQEMEQSRKVFVVHGHDEGRVAQVARCLKELGLEPIVLHEQPNRGKTIIEKFEENSDVRFAVVIMTNDDVGASNADAAKKSFQPRARQNVILELGYFVGRLGRDRVAVLAQQGVEQPSDIHGVVYTPLDQGGAWKYLLVRELKAVGFEVSADAVK